MKMRMITGKSLIPSGKPKLPTFCLVTALLLTAWIGKAYGLSPRNVLLITIDTLRADHLGCYGHKGIKTPNIDGLASEGVLFEWAFSPVPLTLPAHASILTGTYPPFHGIRNNGSYALSDSMVTLAEYFQEQGYATAAFVSSFILDQRFGLHQGFSEYNDDLADDPNQPELLDRERRAEEVTRACLKWLSKAYKDTFFVWIHYMDPHEAYHPPNPYAATYAHNLYDGEIAYTDHWIGVLLDSLKQMKILEDTLIVLTSDHGESLGEHGEKTHGIFIYDATLHVPLIIRFPSEYQPSRASALVRLVDIAPTILEIMDSRPKKEQSLPVQGVSLAPLLKGKKLQSELFLYCESLYPKFSHHWSPLEGIRTGEWKYIQSPRPELFEVTKDKHERINLISKMSQKGKKLAHELKSLRQEITPSPDHQGSHKVTLDERTRERLRSLGYVSATPEQGDKGDKGGYPDPKQMVSVLQAVEQGSQHFEKGEYQKALALYQQVIEQDPQNPDAYLFLGYIYEAMGDDEKSITFFEKSVQLENTNLKVYLKLGFQYMKRGRYAEGIAMFKKALELNPRCITAYLNLGQYYLLKTGETQKSRDLFLTARKLDPGNPMVYNLLAQTYLTEGRIREAIAAYEKSLDLDPDQSHIRQQMEKCKTGLN